MNGMKSILLACLLASDFGARIYFFLSSLAISG
jgi:hypothetical protein